MPENANKNRRLSPPGPPKFRPGRAGLTQSERFRQNAPEEFVSLFFLNIECRLTNFSGVNSNACPFFVWYWQRKRLRPYIKSQRLKNGALAFVQLFGGEVKRTHD